MKRIKPSECLGKKIIYNPDKGTCYFIFNRIEDGRFYGECHGIGKYKERYTDLNTSLGDWIDDWNRDSIWYLYEEEHLCRGHILCKKCLINVKEYMRI